MRVYRVTIPPMSTIGTGYAFTATEHVTFVGDHRPMRALGEEVARAKSVDDLPEAYGDLIDMGIGVERRPLTPAERERFGC